MVETRIKQKVAVYLMKKKQMEKNFDDGQLGVIKEMFDELTAAAKEKQEDADGFFKWFMATAFEDRWLHEEEKLTK
ncbi:MAG: hypothetical protein GY771_09545 [bacterium]|nr:hypothetical protein [bacterium]